MDYQQENNYPKAFLATGIIVAILIALFYFIVFQNPPVEDEGTGGILVNYGTTDEGAGKDITSVEQPSVAEKPNRTAPDKVTETQPKQQPSQTENSPSKIVTQNTEDAAAVAANAKKPNPTVATTVNKPQKKPVINQNALYKGSASKGTGEGDGKTSTPGNQGSANGSALSNNYGKGGSGGGLNMGNWSFVEQPEVANPHRVPGVVVIDFTVDENGNVLEAHVNAKKTKAEAALRENCTDAILNAKFKSSTPATGNEKGEMTFVFKVD